MPERRIDPKFNIHSSYRKLNIVNPYRHDSGGGGTPTGHEPETTALMASIGWSDDSTPSPHNGLTYAQVYNVLDTYFASGKADGWLALLKAVYLFIGDNADSHKWNAVNPQDTNAAHRINWYGSAVHSATGWKNNGASYGDTNYNQLVNSTVGDESFGMYVRNHVRSESQADFGVISSANNYAKCTYFFVGFTQGVLIRHQTNVSKYVFSGGINNTAAFYQSTLKNGAFSTVRNNIIEPVTPLPNNTGLNNLNFYLGCRNLDGNMNSPSTREYCYAFIGEGLTDTQAVSHYNAVQQLQTDLGRNV